MKLNAEVVRNEIQMMGKNLNEYAEEIGIKNYNLSKYLHGANVPMRVAERIADDLNVDIYDILIFDGFHY